MDDAGLQTTDHCQSCGTPRDDKFCGACGEPRFDRHDLSMPHVIEHGIEGFTHFDFKLPRTAWTLLTRPGRVEADILAGRQVMYTKPFALFVVINLIYYFGASALGLFSFQTPARTQASQTFYAGYAANLFEREAASKGLSLADYYEKYDALSQSISKTLPFLFTIVMALVLSILLIRHRRYVLEHYYVSLLWTARMLLVVLAVNFSMIPLPYVTRPLGDVNYEIVFTLLVTMVLTWTWYGTFRTVYAMGPVRATLTGAAATLAFLVILVMIYRPLLMHLTVAML